ATQCTNGCSTRPASIWPRRRRQPSPCSAATWPPMRRRLPSEGEDALTRPCGPPSPAGGRGVRQPALVASSPCRSAPVGNDGWAYDENAHASEPVDHWRSRSCTPRVTNSRFWLTHDLNPERPVSPVTV